jgi:hypothetical protein
MPRRAAAASSAPALGAHRKSNSTRHQRHRYKAPQHGCHSTPNPSHVNRSTNR